MVEHLWEKYAELMQSKENDSLTRKRIDPALLHLIEAMQGVWGKENPLRLAPRGGPRAGKYSSGGARDE